MYFKKVFILLFNLTILLILISGVSAESSFTDLQNDINHNEHVLDVQKDYVYNNVLDQSISENGVSVNKSNYVINGNNHTIDVESSFPMLNIKGFNITINNLNFKCKGIDSLNVFIYNSKDITFNNCSFYNSYGYGLYTENSSIILNNISYNCSNSYGLLIGLYSNISLYNSNFDNLDNILNMMVVLGEFDESNSTLFSSNLYLNNSNFNNINFDKTIENSLIINEKSNVYITNCLFNNLNSNYGTVILSSAGNLSIESSKFSDISADLTGGVIISKNSNYIKIKSSDFTNCSSRKNGGVIFADSVKYIDISKFKFLNDYSNFGGGILALDSSLFVNNSKFINNKAYDGAAIYTSYTNVTINSLFENNPSISNKLYYTNGGALYIDKASYLRINNSKFINNKANKGGAVFIYDCKKVKISNSYFKNNKKGIYGVFTDNYVFKNNKFNKDSLSLNNTFYFPVVVYNNSVKYKILNNSLNTSKLPESFDLRDHGWVTPVRNQGNKGFCWVFAVCDILESSSLRHTGKVVDISKEILGNLMLKYSKLGDNRLMKVDLKRLLLNICWRG